MLSQLVALFSSVSSVCDSFSRVFCGKGQQVRLVWTGQVLLLNAERPAFLVD